MSDPSPSSTPHPGFPEGPASVKQREFRTADPAEAQIAVQCLYPGTRLEPLQHQTFECELRTRSLAPATFVRGTWPGGGRMETPGFEGGYVLATAVRGGTVIATGGERVEVAPARRGALISPGFSGSLQAEPGTVSRTFILGAAALPAHIAALVGRAPREAVSFEPVLSLDVGPGAAVLDLLHLCWQELERPGASPLLLASLRESLITALLTGAQHSASHLFERPPPSSSRACVRRAEEFMEAHAAEDLTLALIAEAAGVPARSLQAAFRKARGVTPMEFLRERRFDLARRALVEAAPETSVTGVLASLGFGSSPGRFAVQYKERFGESPSATLAAARARLGAVQ